MIEIDIFKAIGKHLHCLRITSEMSYLPGTHQKSAVGSGTKSAAALWCSKSALYCIFYTDTLMVNQNSMCCGCQWSRAIAEELAKVGEEHSSSPCQAPLETVLSHMSKYYQWTGLGRFRPLTVYAKC